MIIGPGPTGLTLVCELLRRGVGCRVIDHAPGPPSGSRATDIHSRTLEIFEDLSIVEDVLKQDKKVKTFRGYTDGRLLTQLDLDSLDTAYPFATMTCTA